MAFLTMNFRSSALGKMTELRLLVNEAAKPPYPVYFLLHGLSDDASAWTRLTRLEAHAAAFPFLVVMPDGGRSFYCDSPLGAYETYLVKELVPLVDRLFPTRRGRRARTIGGLSMGGYGAIKLALKYPRLFGCACGHSSALGAFALDSDGVDWPEDVRLVANHVDRARNDPFRLSTEVPVKDRPALYFDCGRQDFLFRANERFHRHLTRLGYAHTYRRHAGNHNWAYWDARIGDALAFAADRLAPDSGKRAR